MNSTVQREKETEVSTRPGYRICARCVMDISDPCISFDGDGVCNHCHDYDIAISHSEHSFDDGQQLLYALVEKIKNDGRGKPYDCVIGVSGGVDSTYVAWKTKELGLRPLAVHLDNGWNSEVAVSNINKTLTKLEIDLYTRVLDWEEFKDIQIAFLRASTPDAEVPSDHAIFATMYHAASKNKVRYVITGLNIRTETHLPTSWSQGHLDWGYLRAVHKQFGSRKIKDFPYFNLYQFLTNFRHSHETINILNHLDYSKKEALCFLERELGWNDYGGKHQENIYTRWYQGYYLVRKFGYDKRRSHLSSRICSGEVTREEALEELEKPPYPIDLQKHDCEYVAKKLGLNSQEFKAIMTAQPRRFEDFPSYRKLIDSQKFTRGLRAYQFFKYGLLRRPR